MKKLLLLFMLLLPLAINVNEVSAGSFRELGTQVAFKVYIFDGDRYLIFRFNNSKECFLQHDTLIKFKLNNDEEVRLAFQNNLVSDNGYVVFKLTSELKRMLDIGIKKIAISTIPNPYIYDGDETKRFAPLLKLDFEKLKDDF